MNREILFRGKRVDNNQWTEGFLSFIYTDGRNSNGFIYTDKAQIYSPVEVRSHDVYTSTVGQFTGLCDKNGLTKIFEGDIIKTDYHELKMVVCYTTRLASFSLENRHWMYPHYFEEAVRTKDVEVIGNIHDTPDLAK